MQPMSYTGTAFNEVHDSENRIHGDEVASQFGFEGALVPGVIVSAYLAHPAVAAWGLDYVARGAARVVVEKPVYDGREFTVTVSAEGEHAYDAVLADASGSTRARARCWLPESLPEPPRRRGDRLLSRGDERPRGTPETMRRLREQGLGALPVRWDGRAELTRYFRDASLLPPPLSEEGSHCAHLGFVLGLTNWALGGNVRISPWLHLQTESQCFEAIAFGTDLVVESAIVDLFEKKGHHFCDVDVAAFRREDDVAVMQARLRAIYQLRAA
jgi:hypothetical protein